MTSNSPLELPVLMAAKYCLVKPQPIHSGLFGLIYLVKDIITGEICACKVINYTSVSVTDRYADAYWHEDEVQTEMTLHSILQHRQIVSYKGYYKDKYTHRFFLVVEYCEGGDLAQRLSNHGTFIMSEDDLWRFFVQMLRAVNFLHSPPSRGYREPGVIGVSSGHGIILHRNLTPSNFLLQGKKVKLADFGAAKVLPKHLAATTGLVGTANYLAPEIRRGHGEKEYSSAADMWSLGCILVEMTTNSPAFPDSDIHPQIDAKGYTPPKVSPGFSSNVQHAVDRLLALDPSARPTALELLETPELRLTGRHVDLDISYEVLFERESKVNKRESDVKSQLAYIEDAKADLEVREQGLRTDRFNLEHAMSMRSSYKRAAEDDGRDPRAAKRARFERGQENVGVLRSVIHSAGWYLVNV